MTITADKPLRNRDRGRGVVHPTSFLRVVRSETLKFLTIPSPLVLMLCTIVVMVGIAVLMAFLTGSMSQMAADDPELAGVPTMTAAMTVFAGVGFAQLIVGSLGVIIGSSEFTTGMARTTFTAVPRRLSVLGAKIVVLAVAVAVVTAVGALISAASVWPIAESYELGFEMWDAESLQGLWTTTAYLAAVALIGLALGILLRNAAGGIVILAALLFVLPTVLTMVPSDLLNTMATYLPDAAYAAVSGTGLDPAEAEAMGMQPPLEPWQGWLTLGGWTLLPILAAGALLRHRDI